MYIWFSQAAAEPEMLVTINEPQQHKILEKRTRIKECIILFSETRIL